MLLTKVKFIAAVFIAAMVVQGCGDDSSDDNETSEEPDDGIVPEGVRQLTSTLNDSDGTEVSDSTAEVVATREGIFIRVSTTGLEEGNVYTAHAAIANTTSSCANKSACTLAEIIAMEDGTFFNMDAVVGKENGEDHITAWIPVNNKKRELLGTDGLTALKKPQIRFFLRDKGPAVTGLEKEQFTTFGGGCTAASNEANDMPSAISGDGDTGDYDCENIQEAFFNVGNSEVDEDFTIRGNSFTWGGQGVAQWNAIDDNADDQVEGGTAVNDNDSAYTLISHPTGVYLFGFVEKVVPGTVYTSWVPFANNPEECAGFEEETACTPGEIVTDNATWGGDVTYGDGWFADSDGEFITSSYVAAEDDDDPHSWMNKGLQEPTTGEIHFFLQWHGELIDGYMGIMVNTADGGCTRESLAGPIAAKGQKAEDGPETNTCAMWHVTNINQQFVEQSTHGE